MSRKRSGCSVVTGTSSSAIARAYPAMARGRAGAGSPAILMCDHALSGAGRAATLAVIALVAACLAALAALSIA
jgi:hypothetical protein